jgi:SPP1 gp7 family putative phage head morphogenesis protein
MKTANEELADALIRHQIWLLRYSGTVRNKITALLSKSEKDIAEKIRGYELGAAGLSNPQEYQRLKALYAAIEEMRKNAWGEVDSFFTDEMKALTYQEPIVLSKVVQTVLPVTVSTVVPTANLLRSMVLSKPFEGRVMSDWVSTLAADDIRRMENAIQLGMVAGEPMDKIAKRVAGSSALKGSDGITALTRRQIDAVTRTAVQHVANNARNEWLKQNSDLFKLEQFVATLDSRTTPICRAEDGKRYPVGQGPIPPLHYGCRSLRVAVFNDKLLGNRPANPTTESILVGEYADENGLGSIGARDDLPRGQKGKYDEWARGRIRELVGPVPADSTYQTWLEKQSKAFQEDVLGIAKSKLFRDGGLTLDKFVDHNGNELTLKDLVKKHEEAFVAAGLDPSKYF